MQVKEIYTPNDILEVSTLAHAIWREYYPPIIGKEQVEYMLQKFQTPKAILANINEGYDYFILLEQNHQVGYCCVQKRAHTLFVSKLYIQKKDRQKGYAKACVDFLCTLAHENGLSSLSLSVNKNNLLAIKAYTALGFVNTGALVQDIQEGYVMDDYSFELGC